MPVSAGSNHAHLGPIVQELRVGHFAAQPVQMQVPDGPSIHVHVEAAGHRVPGQAAVLGRRELCRRLRAAVDRAVVAPHPFPDALQSVEGALVKLTPRRRPDIQEQVPSLADRVGEHAHELVRALPGRLVPVVPPGTGKGLAGLPQHTLAVHPHPVTHHDLFGRPDVPAPGSIQQVQAVVDQHLRLQFAHEAHQICGAPVVPALAILAGVGKVEEEIVDLAEARQQFPHLSVQVLRIARHVPATSSLPRRRVIALRVPGVDREVGVVPVNQ